jgi:hypothetical protein
LAFLLALTVPLCGRADPQADTETRRLEQTTEMERLYARYGELEARQEPLLNRLGELGRTP